VIASPLAGDAAFWAPNPDVVPSHPDLPSLLSLELSLTRFAVNFAGVKESPYLCCPGKKTGAYNGLMRLSVFCSERRREIFEALGRGEHPRDAEFDAEALRQGLLKGSPQVGATRFEPSAAIFEFLFPDPLGAAVVLSVKVRSPERIVCMPVPDWVVENVWQGDVDGSFRFESEAREMLRDFEEILAPEANAALFEKQPAKRRE